MKAILIRWASMTLLAAIVMCSLGINAAYADTLDDWNRSCRAKTKGSTEGWVRAAMEGPPDIVLPGNTYVKKHSTSRDDVVTVDYMLSNGKTGCVYVKRSNIVSAVVWFTDEDGDLRSINEIVYYEQYGGNPPSTGSTGGSSSTGGSTSSSSTGKTSGSITSRQKTTKVEEAPLVATWSDKSVTVKVLGVKKSLIVVDKEEQTVATAELVFETEADADKAIAVIHAPNTGKCSLRKKASTSAGVIVKCKAGTVVSVLEYGSKFCKINYDGKVGYVLTSCLKFQECGRALLGTGVLTYNGKATGRTTINVRNSPDGDSAKIAEWKTGTKVQVFALDNGWYEIEYDGVHGYVMQKYLTMEE